MAYWARLASGGSTDPKVDVIITAKDGVPAGQVAIAIEQKLQSRDVAAKDLDTHLKQIRARTRLSYSRSTLQADLTFPELLAAVMPLSIWWQTQLNAARSEEDGPAAIGRNSQPGGGETAEMSDLVLGRIARFLAGRESEKGRAAVERITINDAIRDRNASFQLYRFAALVSLTEKWRQEVLVAGNDPTKVSAARENALKTARSIMKPDALLVTLLADCGEGLTAVLQLIDMGTGRLAEQQSRPRRDHDLDLVAVKIFAVSANRDAESTVARARKTIKADAAGHVFDIDTRGIIWGVIDSGIDIRHPAFLRQTDISETEPSKPPQRLGGQWLAASRVLRTFDFTYIRDLLSTGEHPGTAPELGAKDRDVLRDDLSRDCLAMALCAPAKQRRRLISKLTTATGMGCRSS